MFLDFFNNVIVIDDKQNEAEIITKPLEKKDCHISFFLPDSINKSRKKFRNYSMLIIDLFLEDSQSLETNISRIRGYIKKIVVENSHPYGIVLWTKHDEDAPTFLDKISKEENKFTKPLFVIPLSKKEYLSDSKKDILIDIENQIKKNKAALFALTWFHILDTCRSKVINRLYNAFFKEYDNPNKYFDDDLYYITKLYAGFQKNDFSSYQRKHIELLNLFDEILSSEVHHAKENIALKDIFKDVKETNSTNNRKYQYYSKINEALHIVYCNDTYNVLPGNVYLVKKINFNNDNVFKILVEFTPPCDFAIAKNRNSRVLEGYIIPENIYNEFTEQALRGVSGMSYYTELKGINFTYKKRSQKLDIISCIVIDFNNFTSISDKKLRSKKLLFRFKDKTLSDIQQKFAAHAIRIGVSVI